jgi:Type II secretion system (T2SS), protein G
MSEKEGGDSKFMTGFLLGFLCGVLIALGVGASFVVFRGGRQEALHVREAVRDAEMARAEAEEARAHAEAERRKAEEAALAAKKPEQKGKEDGKAKEKAAREGLKRLEQAVLAYKLNNREYPPGLQLLTDVKDGKPPYVEEAALVDPWGRPYQYDPVMLSKTGMPLISSQGAEPGVSRPIRNWTADPQDRQQKDRDQKDRDQKDKQQNQKDQDQKDR